MRLACLTSLLWFLHCISAIDTTDVIALRDYDGIIEVSESNYEFLSRGARNFYSVLLITTTELTSNGRYCDLCDGVEYNVRKTSKAVRSQLSAEIDAEIMFFKLDISQLPSFVNDMNLKTIPHLLVYPPGVNETDFAWHTKPFFQFDVTPGSIKDPVRFADFLARICNIHIQIHRDFDANEFLQYFVPCLTIFYVFKKKILPLISNKSKFFSGLFAFGIIFLSITGYKFTQINEIPFLARNPEGQVMFFSGGMHWQFGIEIFTVSSMYLVMASSLVGIILVASVGKLNENLKNAFAVLLLGSLMYTFSYFQSCFLIKNPAYPYSF
ncbi:LAMI_0G11342g1_1 [Lachancea mirantina]|uniref:LAMI_0G11342g1_1 n=1 Tax=Lachancea mirantina TaxID=1230905 RepID=A0A1G4KB04_9SACH|nr:LAMI_0G11342g1_1 [Lachancea mirantina]